MKKAKQTEASADSIQTPNNGFLYWVERIGNKLPHPFWMFVTLIVMVIVLSFLAAAFEVGAQNPQTGEVIEAVNLFSAPTLRRFTQEMITNFAHFAPLGLVLVMLMGVSVAERSGLLTALMRTVAFSVPKMIVLPVIIILGACGNIGSDAGMVIVPPIAAIIFMSMGLHPIAGLIVGYAAATAGFTANFVIAGTDVLLAGITTEVSQNIGDGITVSAPANWYFMMASTVMVAICGAFIAKRFTIPRCQGFASQSASNVQEAQSNVPNTLKPEERKGLIRAGLVALVYCSAVAATVIPANGILRNQVTGSLVPSPFLSGLIPILFFLFVLCGYTYGKSSKSITQANDIIKFMEEGMRGLASYVVLMLVVAQFINLIGWSRLDTIMAIRGAGFLTATGLTGPLLFAPFIILVAIVNIFIGSGSAKWAMFAPIFVPMLAQLGYTPAFVQLMYRVGDSVTNCVTPLSPYFPLLLGWIHAHDPRLKMGTVMSLLVPYAVILLVMWIVLLFIWYGLGLPIGVGEGIHLP